MILKTTTCFISHQRNRSYNNSRFSAWARIYPNLIWITDGSGSNIFGPGWVGSTFCGLGRESAIHGLVRTTRETVGPVRGCLCGLRQKTLPPITSGSLSFKTGWRHCSHSCFYFPAYLSLPSSMRSEIKAPFSYPSTAEYWFFSWLGGPSLGYFANHSHHPSIFILTPPT